MAADFRLKVYAYYYPWHSGADDNKWEVCREYSPYLGLYDSSDEAVVRQHVEWALEFGIDGFLVEWFGEGTEFASFVNGCTGLLRSVLEDYPDLEFAIFFDQALRFYRRDFSGSHTRQAFVDEFLRIAADNFGHPNYMHVDGRPVVAIYLTRGTRGNYASLLVETRDRVDSAGFGRPYLVGDQVWWFLNTDNFEALDAVTAYNLHNNRQLRTLGGGVRQWAAHTAAFFASVLPQAAAVGTDVFPCIGHAYNDFALLGNLPFIPTVVEGAPPAYRQDTVECMKAQRAVWRDCPRFRRTGTAYLFVTSFNEWPERSMLEPSAEIETFNYMPDFRDGTHLYLQPHRFEHLEGIREGKRFVERNILPNL